MLRHDARTSRKPWSTRGAESSLRSADVKPRGGGGQRLHHRCRWIWSPSRLIVAEEMNTTTRVDRFRKLVRAQKV